MPPAVGFAGGFVTALTGGALAFGAPTAAFAAGVAAAGTIGSTLVTSALVLGANLLTRSLASETVGVNAAPIRGSVRQAVPIQRIPYGYVRTGGAVFFLEDSKVSFLFVGLLLSARRITAIRRFWIGDEEAIIDPVSFEAQNREFRNDAGTVSRLRISTRLGTADQPVDPLILANFANIDANFRQRGHATVVARYSYGADIDEFEKLWGQVQIPNLTVDLSGVGVHDPRDLNSNVEDPDTWPFRRTAALVQADWLHASYGGRVSPDRIRWDEIAKAAEYDDGLVERKDGSLEPRYTIDGVVNLDQNPAGVMQAMLGANRGFVVTNQGRVWVSSSQPLEPVLVIRDKDLRGGFEYRHTNPKKDLINTARIRFIAPDREYNEADGPVRIKSDLVTADGESLEGTLGLPFTLDHPRAQRLADLAIRESRLQRGITCTLPMRRALGLRSGHVVRVQSSLFSFMDGLYQVKAGGVLDGLGGVVVTLGEYDATLAAQWVASTDEQDFELATLDVS